MRERIYVAGKYSSETKEGVCWNVKDAITIGNEIQARGHYVFIPHLYYFTVEDFLGNSEKEKDYEWYLEQDVTFLKYWANALYVVSLSNGVNAEIKVAKDLGLKIYNQLDQIKKL